jgi:hypothetical protein
VSAGARHPLNEPAHSSTWSSDRRLLFGATWRPDSLLVLLTRTCLQHSGSLTGHFGCSPAQVNAPWLSSGSCASHSPGRARRRRAPNAPSCHPRQPVRLVVADIPVSRGTPVRPCVCVVHWLHRQALAYPAALITDYRKGPMPEYSQRDIAISPTASVAGQNSSCHRPRVLSRHPYQGRSESLAAFVVTAFSGAVVLGICSRPR